MNRALLALIILLSGCTYKLWAPKYEVESVNGFYVNRETDELFVAARDTAYVFPIESGFADALLLAQEAIFHPKFEDFLIDEKNRVKGTVTLFFIESDPSEEFIAKIMALGFEKNELNQTFKLSEEIEGRRYTIEGDLPLEKLEKEYLVKIEQPATFTETAGKIVATPAAITIDTLVTIPTAFLIISVMALGSP